MRRKEGLPWADLVERSGQSRDNSLLQPWVSEVILTKFTDVGSSRRERFGFRSRKNTMLHMPV